MTRAGSFDGEIGKGRQKNGDDSSSSRESSPVPRRTHLAPNRSLSPPSDDGDVVIQNENKDKTSPPADRPIIRQAVAFSDQASQVPVMTYEAKVVQPKKNHFLPGQAVPPPPKQKSPKKNQPLKKPRRQDAYSGQTSRFRLEMYDPTPPTEPPTTSGNGPYSSLYRNVGPVFAHRKSAHQCPQAGLPTISGSTNVPNARSFLPNNFPSRRLHNESNTTPAIPILQTENSQQIMTANGPTTSQAQTQAATPRSPRPLSVESFSRSRYVTDRRTISRNTSTKSSSPDSCFPGLTQIITLLIKDIRNDLEEPDHQLAEVKVPLKKADELEEGWWADAKDIAEQLQAGAARIDGPARVYTRRGKYRQFILRITSGNKDEIVSANVPVSSERTLGLVVELLHPPGVPAHPLQRPRRRTHDDNIERPEDRMDVDSNRSVPRKRRVSPSFDEYDNHSDHHSSKIRRDQGWDRPQRLDSWRHNPSIERGQRQRSYSPDYATRASPSPPILARALPTVHVGPGYLQREEDDESCELPDESFIRAVERLLEEDAEVLNDYSKAIASNKICDLVKQYEMVSRMFNKWIGKRAHGFSQPIEEIHIARALEIDDPQTFISNCEESLALLRLYGKRGRVVKDPRVLEMLEDQNPLPVNSNPVERLLRLLRAVDDAWRNDRSGPLLNGINLPDRPGSGAQTVPQMTSASPKPNYPGSSQAAAEAEERAEARYLSKGKSMFI